LLVISSGPLLVMFLAATLGLTSDPNPNPIYFGMMAMFTFWPGLILMGIGIYNEKKSAAANSKMIPYTSIFVCKVLIYCAYS